MGWSPGSVGPVAQANGVISTAQCLALFTTPVTLIPAAGPNQAILPWNIFFTYRFSGAAFTDGGGSLQVLIGGFLGFQTIATAGWWDQAADQVWESSLNFGKFAAASFRGGPLKLAETVANPTGGGTSFLEWSILYSIFTL